MKQRIEQTQSLLAQLGYTAPAADIRRAYHRNRRQRMGCEPYDLLRYLQVNNLAQPLR